jgi:serralysin
MNATRTSKITKGALASGLAVLTLATPAFAKDIIGNDGSNKINGTPKADLIIGNGGDDVINARRGDDRVFGGVGNDRINGFLGNDRLFGNSGDDYIHGWAGDDVLRGNLGNDTLIGDTAHAGDRHSKDVLYGGGGDDKAYGGDAADSVFGGQGNDLVHGQGGNDLVSGGPGDDVVRGGNGNDRLFGNQGNDKVYGGLGHDEISVLTLRDTPDAEVNDYVDAGPGNDVIRSADGEPDTIKCGPGKDTVFGDATDVFVGASDKRPLGTCEKLVITQPSQTLAAPEDAVEDPAEGNEEQ